ncbi:Os03g0331000 [Oryza sativa Japonica Group]|nr:Os03g0331000 [Oryza sativa Japonica Group]
MDFGAAAPLIVGSRGHRRWRLPPPTPLRSDGLSVGSSSRRSPRDLVFLADDERRHGRPHGGRRRPEPRDLVFLSKPGEAAVRAATATTPG